MLEQAAMDILLPVLESSMVLAAHYTKCSGRNTVTKRDLELALKYTAQHHVGDKIGSMFPEIYEESDTDSIESGEESEVDDDDEPFTEYQGDDEWCVKMNKSLDTWDTWNPVGIAEILLKDAIEKKSV